MTFFRAECGVNENRTSDRTSAVLRSERVTRAHKRGNESNETPTKIAESLEALMQVSFCVKSDQGEVIEAQKLDIEKQVADTVPSLMGVEIQLLSAIKLASENGDDAYSNILKDLLNRI